MVNKKIKIVFFGTPDFVVPVLQTLVQNFEVVGVVTAPDKPVGRKQILTPSPINLAFQAEGWEGYNLQIFTPGKLDAEVAQKLQDLKPDLFVVAAYGKIIPQNILDIPKYGAINIHPSLLPKYRGPSPLQSAILNGDKTSGVTIIKMDAKMDHGPVIYAEEFSISTLDNFQTLSTKMFLRAGEILPKIIPAFTAGKIKLQEQNENNATYCKIIKKEDGYFDLKNLNDSPVFFQKLDRMIRAYYPWPTAWTRWEGKIVKFLPSSVIPAKAGIHGSRVKHGMTKIENRNDKFLIQMEGKKAVKLEEFLCGYPNFPIKNLS